MTRVARGSIFSGAKHFHVLTDGLPGLDVFREPNMKNFYLVTVEEKAKDTGVFRPCVLRDAKSLAPYRDFRRRPKHFGVYAKGEHDLRQVFQPHKRQERIRL